MSAAGDLLEAHALALGLEVVANLGERGRLAVLAGHEHVREVEGHRHRRFRVRHKRIGQPVPHRDLQSLRVVTMNLIEVEGALPGFGAAGPYHVRQ
jgi:hypothetical protein